MATLKDIGFTKLKASTFIEVMVALVVLTCTFFIAAYFLAGMNNSGFNIQHRQAEDAIQNYQYTTIQNKDFSNADSVYGQFKVERQIKQYGSPADLLQLGFSVVDKQQQIILKKTILYYAPDNLQ